MGNKKSTQAGGKFLLFYCRASHASLFSLSNLAAVVVGLEGPAPAVVAPALEIAPAVVVPVAVALVQVAWGLDRAAVVITHADALWQNIVLTVIIMQYSNTVFSFPLGSQQSSPPLNQCLLWGGGTQLLWPHFRPTLQSCPVSQSPSPSSHGVMGVQQPVFWPRHAARISN